MTKIRICIIKPELPDPLSFIRYKDNVTSFLELHGVEVGTWDWSKEVPPSCDVVWDPSSGGGRVVNRHLEYFAGKVPIVVTMHGTVPFSAPAEIFGVLPAEIHQLAVRKHEIKQSWKHFSVKIDRIIAVSNYSANEIIKHFNFLPEKINVIYHGVSAEFYPNPHRTTFNNNAPLEYLFHVSTGATVKNVQRLIQAYDNLPADIRPELCLAIQNIPDVEWPNGVRLIPDLMSHAELAVYYQRALALVFPSLEESFGLPIVEAMASGCPVITSDRGGCAEVAAGAALMVNPESVEELTAALLKLIENPELRHSLRLTGLKRALDFNWRKCGESHLEVFKQVI